MAPKKKAITKGPSSSTNVVDDDWENLASEVQADAKPPHGDAPHDSGQPVANAGNPSTTLDAASAAAAFLSSLQAPASKKKPAKKKAEKPEIAPVPTDEPLDVEQEVKGTEAAGKKGKKGAKKDAPETKPSAMAALILAKQKEQREREEEVRRIREEEERIRLEEERKIFEEEERIRLKKLREKEKKLEKIEKQKKEGTYLTASQKVQSAIAKEKLKLMLSLHQQVPKYSSNDTQSDLHKSKSDSSTDDVLRRSVSDSTSEVLSASGTPHSESTDSKLNVLDSYEEDTSTNVTEIVPESWEDEIEAKTTSNSTEKHATNKEGTTPSTSTDKPVTTATKDVELRSPICVVMGHVDTGKTSLLDCIRHTTIQRGEAGGITQQIGATYFPIESLRKSTEGLRSQLGLEYKIPGLLIIDTPGHESFHNLRSRGSSLCDIAVLVVDIMHLLEKQTIESLNMLQARKCPFVVALNKVDRLYGWKPVKNKPFRDSLGRQEQYVRDEFERRLRDTITEFMKLGLNASVYYENTDPRNTISLVPTSAVTGEGIPDLLGLMMHLTQTYMKNRLQFSEKVKAAVLEKKIVKGTGPCLDVILVNGNLRVGDNIVVCGLNGAISTTVRSLFTPQPLKELRSKTEFSFIKEVKAAIGVRVFAPVLEDAVAGTALYVVNKGEDPQPFVDLADSELENVRKLLKTEEAGVHVQASTLGSLEALLVFLSENTIPVGSFSIGPVFKKDVVKVQIMNEKHKEYAVILAFDVETSQDAETHAKNNSIRIFSSDIIYHLFDQFSEYVKEIEDEKLKTSKEEAIFPCILKIMPNHVIRHCDPIIVGVDVVEGVLRPNTPVCVRITKKVEAVKEMTDDLMGTFDELSDEENDVQKRKMKRRGSEPEMVEKVTILHIGTIKGLEVDKKEVTEARQGKSVAISITQTEGQKEVVLGRNFSITDLIYSKLSRKSIHSLETNFPGIAKDHLELIDNLKKIQGVLP